MAGCSSRTQTRNATKQVCNPTLKTNSVQGVLVFGSNENGPCGEAVYPMTRCDLPAKTGTEFLVYRE